MKVENLVALRFLLEDELYLLDTDKTLYEQRNIPEPIIKEPEIRTPAADPVIEGHKPEIKTEATDFKYLGENLKNFLILVHYPGLEFIADEHLIALQSILKRKELEIGDVAILNMAAYPDTGFDALTAFFKPAKLLVLGQAALPQGMDPLVLNNIKSSEDHTALYSFSFGEMMASTENKKAFWEQMKSL